MFSYDGPHGESRYGSSLTGMHDLTPLLCAIGCVVSGAKARKVLTAKGAGAEWSMQLSEKITRRRSESAYICQVNILQLLYSRGLHEGDG